MPGPCLRMKKKMRVPPPLGPISRRSKDESVLTISRSKTFLEEFNPHDDEANKRKGRGMQTFTDDTNAQNEKQIINAMLISLMVHFALVLNNSM